MKAILLGARLETLPYCIFLHISTFSNGTRTDIEGGQSLTPADVASRLGDVVPHALDVLGLAIAGAVREGRRGGHEDGRDDGEDLDLHLV